MGSQDGGAQCASCGADVAQEVRFCPRCGTQVVVDAGDGDPLLGTTLSDKYRISEIIGEGSMGTVYLAEHISLAKTVAIKVLRKDLEVSGEILQRFQREGIAAGRFDHPGAIQIFDFDQDGGLSYLAMEYVEGCTLTEHLRAEGALTREPALSITRQILEALAAAHESGIVHRDLKPDNVMIKASSGGRPRIKVLDFGLSKLVHQPLGSSLMTQPGRIMGTPRYMAPEQGSGDEVDARTDLYAVGLVLYELLAGQYPFRADTMRELLVKQATETPPSLLGRHPDVDEELDEFLSIALEKDPADRYQSAAEMLDALQPMLSAAPTARKQKQPAKRRRSSGASQQAASSKRSGSDQDSGKPAWLVPALVGGALALGAAGYFLTRGSDAPPAAPPARARQVAAGARSPEQSAYLAKLDQARTLLKQGDASGALQVTAGLDLSPEKDAEFFVVQARARRLRGDDDLAMADFREAERLDETYAAPVAGQGWIALDREDLDTAAARFEAAAALDPAAGSGKGAVELLRGDPKAAVTSLRAAIAADQRADRAHYYLGLALLEQDDSQGAFDALLEAVRQSPQDWRAPAALAQVYSTRGETERAIQQYQDALERGPSNSSVITGLSTLLVTSKRYGEAKQALDEHGQAYSGEATIWLLRSLIASGQGDAAAAGRALVRAQEAGAESARISLLLGQRAQREGDLEAAQALYARAIELDEDSSIAHKNMGLVLMSVGQYSAARDALRLSLQLDREDAYSHYAMGILCMEYLGEPDKAIQAFASYQRLGGGDRRVDGWLQNLKR